MSFKLSLYFWVAISVLLISACSNQESSNSESASQEGIIVEVDSIDEAGFKDLVRNRNGKLLLVNMWATWCIPCREEFPDLVKVASAYQDKDVEIVGISMDFPDEVNNKIKPFLKSQNANFQNYVKNFKDDGAFINMVNPEWSGGLPATFVYDKTGILQKSHFGKGDFEEFRKMIEQVRESES